MADFTLRETGRIGTLLNYVRALQSRRKSMAQKKGAYTKQTWRWFWAILAFSALFLFAAPEAFFLVLLFVFLPLAFIVSYVRGQRAKMRFDAKMPDERRLRFSEEFLSRVEALYRPGGVCRLQVDFTEYLRPEKRKMHEEAQAAYSKKVREVYQDPWFLFKGALREGVDARVAVTELVKRKMKVKAKGTYVTERICERASLALPGCPESEALSLSGRCREIAAEHRVLPQGEKVTSERATVSLATETGEFSLMGQGSFSAFPSGSASCLFGGGTLVEILSQVERSLPPGAGGAGCGADSVESEGGSDER